MAEVPVYAVCTQCAFVRTFGSSARGARLPERCPECGGELRMHGRRERFPSAYLARTSRRLYRIPPLQV